MSEWPNESTGGTQIKVFFKSKGHWIIRNIARHIYVGCIHTVYSIWLEVRLVIHILNKD